MKTTIDAKGTIELEYDPMSIEFQDALAGYKELIEHEGTKGTMLKHIAFYVLKFGYEGIVEGVGYVGHNGVIPKEQPYSGIMVKSNDDFYFEIISEKP